MGRKVQPYGGSPRYADLAEDEYEEIPHYSTSIAAAWELVEEIVRYYFMVEILTDTQNPAPVLGKFKVSCRLWHPGSENRQIFLADTAPLAICLAFRKATEEK